MSGQLDSWISRQTILVKVAQENQKANGKEHKLRPEYSGPYQVMNRLNDIYSIEDLVSGTVIDTHGRFCQVVI